MPLWIHMETLGMILTGDIGPWMMCDDSATLTETVILFGVALLTTLDTLKSHNLLKPDSPIVNIPLIISLFLSFAEEWEGCDQGQGETGWKVVAVKMLDEAGITFVDGQVARGTQKRIEAIREEMANDDDGEEENEPSSKGWTPEHDQDDGVRQWKTWNWKIEVNSHLHLILPFAKTILTFPFLPTTSSISSPKPTPKSPHLVVQPEVRRPARSEERIMISPRLERRRGRDMIWMVDFDCLVSVM